ncbi:hypothetical protein ABFA07_012971 [Porites harrisoni]
MVFSTFLTVWVFISAKGIHGEIFTSLSQLKGLVRLEGALSKTLDNYLEQQSEAPDIIRKFADHVRMESQFAKSDIERYVFHPINSFQLVRRFVRHWKELGSYLEKGTPNDLQWELRINRPAFPTSQDFMGSISAILRIQEVYKLSACVVADGKLHAGNNSGRLGVDECYELGVVSDSKKNYDDVIEWMREALKRMSAPYEYSGALSKVDVLEYLSWAEYKLGLLDDAITHTKDILQKDPKNEQAKTNLDYFRAERLKRDLLTEKSPKNEINNKGQFSFTYERLCRGETRKSQKERDKLFCYYHNDRPEILLKPVKVEMINLDPNLYLFHDVVTDQEINHVIKLARPKLKRAVVTDTSNGNQISAEYRISQSAWLEDSDSSIINRISRRIQGMTGLSLDPAHSEPLQVANYGIGGHYEPHHDYVQNSDRSLPHGEDGDRIATMLIYLSDVDAGGATVFMDIEEFVHPQKGDAVFWYNLDKNGFPDERTKHAACPVVVGSKWVANKWINERGQEFRRPCLPT